MRNLRRHTSLVAATAVLALALAACGGDDASDTESEQTIEEVTDDEMAEADSTVALTGTDSLKYEPESLETTAGVIEIALTSGAVEHNVNITVDGEDVLVVEAGEGETNSGNIELAAGEYAYFCNVPGHREAGMEGTLTVS